MSRKNSGKMVEVTQGVHKGKSGFAFNRDQVEEIRKAGKICVSLDSGKTLIDPKYLKLVGFID